MFATRDKFLCAAVPGRCDYIHNVADLLENTGSKNKAIRCLDIGVGANCIYPIIGVGEYNWKVTGSEIDITAAESARNIVNSNQNLHSAVDIRIQPDQNKIFHNIIALNDSFHVSICNPPFHSSAEEAFIGSERKWRNLSKKSIVPIHSNSGNSHRGKELNRNFGGLSSELFCEGGEKAFVNRMIKESADPFVHKRVGWFTSLVSKEANLRLLTDALSRIRTVRDCRVIGMEFGSKKSRILAWTFKTE